MTEARNSCADSINDSEILNGFRSKDGNLVTVGLQADRRLVLESKGVLDNQEAVHVAWSLLDAVRERGVALPEYALEKLRNALREPVMEKIEKTSKSKHRDTKQTSLLGDDPGK